MSDLFDVAIVGFGPSGAVAAGLLGGQGIRTFVCDRLHEVYDKPRAIALDHEIMRVFQQLGVVAQVEPFTEPFTPSEYHGVDGQLIKRLATVEPPYPLGYVPSLVFSQPPVEAVLRAHVRSLPGVELALGQELLSLTQHPDRVSLQLRGDDGAARTVQARYVIACDGASSTVRGLVGIELEDLSFDEPWLVVDVLVNDMGLAKLPQVSVQYCEPKRPCTYVIGPQNHRRWEISLLPGEDPKEMASEAKTWALLSRWLTPDDAVLWRQASYRFHALVARDWRRGRVFIAGDAAHQQPPFLGQGMCQGVRDVANLCWKLAAVIEGRAADALLDSYGVERREHVRELTTRIKGIGAVIGERDVAKARARDARLLAEAGGTVRTQARQDILPPLTGGLLSGQPHAANGTLFPQPWIMQGGKKLRMDQIAGTGWRLVLGPRAAAAMETAAAGASHLPLRTLRVGGDRPDAWVEADGVLDAWFKRHACMAAIVRPDHYVYGVAASPADLQQQLRTLVARLA